MRTGARACPCLRACLRGVKAEEARDELNVQMAVETVRRMQALAHTSTYAYARAHTQTYMLGV